MRRRIGDSLPGKGFLPGLERGMAANSERTMARTESEPKRFAGMANPIGSLGLLFGMSNERIMIRQTREGLFPSVLNAPDDHHCGVQ